MNVTERWNFGLLAGVLMSAILSSTSASAWAQDLAGSEILECKGKYKGHVKPTNEELAEILKRHREWAWDPIEHENADDLRRANLCEADLSDRHLAGAVLNEADLTGAWLVGTDLSFAFLLGARLRGASLSTAILHEAGLADADLTDANLEHTNLTNSYLYNTHFGGAQLDYVDLTGATFEIDSEHLPNMDSLATAWGLAQLKFRYLPVSLVRIRDEFKKRGLRAQENQLTYAIRRGEAEQAGWFERNFDRVAFDLTCQYGMSPQRALLSLLALLGFFTVVYVVAQKAPGPRGGIWVVWSPDRIQKDEGADEPTRLTDGFPTSSFATTWLGRVCRFAGLHILGLALYFSLLSAFRIGWQALDFGTWLTRMQPREYTLKATGWVRFTSGVQSLISVYLLVLWVITYFGTPFE